MDADAGLKMEIDVEEEEDDEIDETGYKSIKDAVLFAIDVSSSMLQTSSSVGALVAEADSATSAALKCAYALMQQRIISNPNDMMGILLFGTVQSRFQSEEVSHGTYQYPHCYLLSDLDVPAAADVKRLRSMVEDQMESDRLLVPSRQPVAMANVLFCANQIFTTKAPNFSSRRLFLVTDNDNPHAQSRDLRTSAVVRAKDLYDLGVTIELFPISHINHEFDRTKFYDDIVYRSQSSDSEAPAPFLAGTTSLSAGDGIPLLQSLLTSINSKAVPKRTLASNLTFELGSNLRISVKTYVLLKRQEPARSCYVWLNGETPQIAFGKSMRLAEDTARTVEKIELRKAFKFGGENVNFTPEELVELRNFGDPGIRLIGFKLRSMLPIWANLRPATFIYPSEDEFIGSTRTFSALHQTLLRKGKIGIVWYIPRKAAAPYIAALVPGPERLGERGEQLMPPGLWLVPLPFADDIRSNPEISTIIKAPDTLIDQMRKVIQQLQLPRATYDPAKYPNPTLQWHYKILQALALEEDLPEQSEDKTVPKHRQIAKRAGPYVLEWGTNLESTYKNLSFRDSSYAKDHKRSASSSLTSAPKRARTLPKSEQSLISDVEMKTRFRNRTIATLTTPVLKQFISEKNIATSTNKKKAEMIDLIEQYFEKKMELH